MKSQNIEIPIKQTCKPAKRTQPQKTKRFLPAEYATALQTISNTAKIPEYAPASVKKLMIKLDLNEKAFAFLMNVSPSTVRYWTTGAAKPCGLSRRLMQLFDASPTIAAAFVACQDVEV